MSYDPAVALDFFKSAGKPTSVAKSSMIFAEKESGKGLFSSRGSKIYLLLAGEVSLLAAQKPIATVKIGEIFGELAAITQAPRTATAIAATDCKLIALDDSELEAALEKKPAFALMLMSILIGRLRETIARLTAAGALEKGTEWQEAVAFDRARIEALVRGLSSDPPLYFQQGRQIMAEGQKAMLMYAVVKGRVAVSIGGRVVERLGPGGAFGEAALIDQSPRMASAVAETDCELQPITRPAFVALVKTSPQFAYQVLASLAERLRFLTARL
jgi:CRP/FNR family transcriptional regulator, cyclic AMP receptor protein